MRSDPKSEFRAGLFLILPLLLAGIPFSLILGAAAAQKGLTPLEVGLMSALVFAGSAQLVAVDLWSDPAPWLVLGFTAFLVNLRYVLMSASIAAKLKHFPKAGRALFMFFLADETWALAEKRAAEKPLTVWFLLGMIPIFYAEWVVFSVVGALVGGSFQNPERLGLDFAFTAVFIALIAFFWHGVRTGFVVVASAAASALTYLSVEGAWYVIAGAAAGIVVAALIPPTRSGGGPTRDRTRVYPSSEIDRSDSATAESDERGGGVMTPPDASRHPPQAKSDVSDFATSNRNSETSELRGEG